MQHRRLQIAARVALPDLCLPPLCPARSPHSPCRPGTAAGAYKPRVRKELRSLSEQEYKSLIIGLSTMLTISTEAGRRLFGPKYIRCSWAVTCMHACAGDTDGQPCCFLGLSKRNEICHTYRHTRPVKPTPT